MAMSFPNNVNMLFGQGISGLCQKYQINFNDELLQRRNQTREQVLALLTSDITFLDKVFTFKDANSPVKGLFELKDENDKLFFKDKKIASMIKYLLNKGQIEEAISVYLHNLKMQEIRILIRDMNAKKAAEEYAWQVAEFESERLRLQEQMQIIMNDEVHTYAKMHEDLYNQLLGHYEAIKILDKRLEELDEIENELIVQHGNELANDLDQIVPLTNEGDKERRKEESIELYKNIHELEKQSHKVHAQKTHNDLKCQRNNNQVDEKNKQIRALRQEIISHPNFKQPASMAQGREVIQGYRKDNLLTLSPSKFKQQVADKQENEELKVKCQQLEALEEQVKTLKADTQLSLDGNISADMQLEEIERAKDDLIDRFAENQVKHLPEHEKPNAVQQVKQNVQSHLKDKYKEGSQLHQHGQERREIHVQKIGHVEQTRDKEQRYSEIKSARTNLNAERSNKEALNKEKEQMAQKDKMVDDLLNDILGVDAPSVKVLPKSK